MSQWTGIWYWMFTEGVTKCHYEGSAGVRRLESARHESPCRTAGPPHVGVCPTRLGPIIQCLRARPRRLRDGDVPADGLVRGARR